jgi:hypothetical protein
VLPEYDHLPVVGDNFVDSWQQTIHFGTSRLEEADLFRDHDVAM